jgi:putative hemolysin
MRAAVLLALALAACSPAAPPKPSEGTAQKAKMDAATTAYANCIAEGAKTVVVADEAAGTIANRVVIACKPLRTALMADVIAFHQIGHPKFSIDQSKAVAEASVATIEDELRRQTVVSIVQRQTSQPAAAAPEKAT